MQYLAFEAGIEVNGTTIMAVVDGMGVFRGPAERVLSKVGLGEVVPDDVHWYPQQAWLDAFEHITEQVGAETLRAIGRKIPENAIFPPHVDSVESALESIDVAYHMNHRNRHGQVLFDPDRSGSPMLDGIGHYGFNLRAPKLARMVCENPYPCAFDEGIITAMARRFAISVKVEHDGAECRVRGAHKCSYLVRWK